MDKTKLQYFNPASHRVAIYVPDDAKYQRQQPFTDAAAIFLSSLYGSATITPATGFWWRAPSFHRDNINIVYSYTDKVDLKRIIEFCIHLFFDTKEEAIALEVAGSLHFIDAESAAAYIRDNDIGPYPSMLTPGWALTKAPRS